MDKVIESVLGGAGAGVVVAIILGVYDWLRRSRRRKEQIRHIRTVIEKAEDEMQKVRPPSLKEQKLKLRGDVDQIRFLIYKGLIRELTIALEDRSGELSYEQRFELRKFLAVEKETTLSLFQETNPSLEVYEAIVFRDLHSLKWLKLRRKLSNLNR